MNIEETRRNGENYHENKRKRKKKQCETVVFSFDERP